MTQPSRIRLTHPATPDETAAHEAIDSIALMNGKRELLIRHGDETYRLRLTASHKLILTK
ncbi:MAG TPA: hemin uptake protein HemP [Reyranellaceae bacterium]|nr:hemin uptake protein HemP [Reyranellaceae bacterium]